MASKKVSLRRERIVLFMFAGVAVGSFLIATAIPSLQVAGVLTILVGLVLPRFVAHRERGVGNLGRADVAGVASTARAADELVNEHRQFLLDAEVDDERTIESTLVRMRAEPRFNALVAAAEAASVYMKDRHALASFLRRAEAASDEELARLELALISIIARNIPVRTGVGVGELRSAESRKQRLRGKAERPARTSGTGGDWVSQDPESSDAPDSPRAQAS